MQQHTEYIAAGVAAEKSMPLMLLELRLDAGTLRYAACTQDVQFPVCGDTYYARAFSITDIESDITRQITECEVVIDNIDGTLHGFNAAERFYGKELVIKKTFLPISVKSLDYAEKFAGVMEEPRFEDKRWCKIKGLMGAPLGRRLAQHYYDFPCQRTFGDYNCNYNGLADLTALTHEGTVTTAGYESIFDSGLTQADDYWKFGRISIDLGGVIYHRRVRSFLNATGEVVFDVAMHDTVPAGTEYVMYKGCPKTLDACKATYAYGPSGDNKANFKGFIFIGEK